MPDHRLTDLVLKGPLNGLRWETQGYKERDENGNLVHTYRVLYQHPHGTHISRVLFCATGSRSKNANAECLADIYNHARRYIRLCKRMEPEEFWTYAKNCWAWSSKFNDDAFWAFTYKLFHARALYLDTVPDPLEGNPLTEALDCFRDRFFEVYSAEAAIAPFKGKFDRAYIENAEDDIYYHRIICEAYFGLSSADSEGDGTDHLRSTVVEDETTDPNSAKYLPRPRVPDGPTILEREEVLGLFIDLGLRNARHGHRDAYQEIEEIFRKADEEEKEARSKLEKNGEGEDMMMMDVNDQDDDIGDVGIGKLSV